MLKKLLAACSICALFWLVAAGDTSNSTWCKNSEDKMSELLPACLQHLLIATSFDDGVRGEGTVSKNNASYAEASKIVSTLKLENLEYLLAKATPAGKLYAALLLKESHRVGNDRSFGKLLHDDAKVTYRSGCEAFESNVRDIAQAFINDDHFCNFRISR